MTGFKAGAVGEGGKGSRRQTLALGQKATITPGDPMSRMMNQYGKGHSMAGPLADTPPTPAMADTPPTPAMADPSMHSGASAIRGSKGGVKTHPREGGIGPGPNGSYGSDTSYPKLSGGI